MCNAFRAIQLSGEPIIQEIEDEFPQGKLRPPIPLPVYEDLVRRMKKFREDYQAYRTSSSDKTSSGWLALF
jgi:amidase